MTSVTYGETLQESDSVKPNGQDAAGAKHSSAAARHAVVIAEEEVFGSLERIFVDLGWRVSCCRPEDIVRRLFELDPDVVICTRAALWQPVGSGPFMFAEFLKYGSAAEFPILILPRAAAADRSRSKCGAVDHDHAEAVLSSELVARVQFILRPSMVLEEKVQLVFEDVAMDTRSRRVFRSGREVRLRPTEYRVLKHLLENPHQVCSRRDLIRSIWGPVSRIKPRTVDVHIGRLRAALNAGNGANYIRTLPAVGYALDVCP